jgi:hypothetical protein
MFRLKNTAATNRTITPLPNAEPLGISCESVGDTLIVNFTDVPMVSANERRDKFRKNASKIPDDNRSEPIIDKTGQVRYFFVGDNNQKLGPGFVDVGQIPGYRNTITTSTGYVKTGVRGSCPQGVPCADDGCYAMSEIRWKGHCKYLEDNTILLREGHCKEFADFVVQRAYGHAAVRFNTYGDFVNIGHFLATVDVARRLPDKEVLAFTKAFDLIRGAMSSVSRFAMPPNYTLLLSSWIGYPVPDDLARMFPVAEYVNDKSQVKDRTKVCKGHCSTCAYCIGLQPGDRVYLIDHGSKKNFWSNKK